MLSTYERTSSSFGLKLMTRTELTVFNDRSKHILTAIITFMLQIELSFDLFRVIPSSDDDGEKDSFVFNMMALLVQIGAR